MVVAFVLIFCFDYSTKKLHRNFQAKLISSKPSSAYITFILFTSFWFVFFHHHFRSIHLFGRSTCEEKKNNRITDESFRFWVLSIHS